MKTIKNIKESLKLTFKQLNKSKFITLILVISQILFLFIAGFIFYTYGSTAMDYRENIIEPIENGALENLSTLSKESESINQSYYQLQKYLFSGLLLLFISYIFINGINWELSAIIVNNKFSYFRYLRKFIAFSSIFILTSAIILYLLVSLTIGISNILALILAILIIIISDYFMYISFGLINNQEMNIKEIKKHLKLTFKIGVKNLLEFLVSYVVIWGILGFSLLMIALYSETMHIALMVLALLVPIIVLIIGRIYLINLVRKFT